MVSPGFFKVPAGLVFFFNIDARVGPNCPNKVDDVQLVQFGFRAMLKKNPALSPAPLAEAISKITPGEPYKGTAGEALTVAIREIEKKRGGPQDGFVSVIHGPMAYYGDEHYGTLARLGIAINDVYGDKYPRIDKADECPAQLKAVVKTMFMGN